MPSVGMRRTTRIFGARVLRSGRRLWSEKNNNGEWVELLDNSRDSAGDATKRKERGRHGNDLVSNQEVTKMDVDEEVAVLESENLVPKLEVANDRADRRWGIVYTRKRKKEDYGVDSSSVGNAKRFGKQFYRKKLRRKAGSELTTKCDSSISLQASGGSYKNPKLWSLLVVADRSLCSWNLVSSILSSILRYMWSARVGLRQLSAIISMKAIVSVFSSCGICFLKGPKLIKRGSCVIWHANTSIPMFRVDYSTAPHCFMYLNSRRVLEFDRLSCSLGQHLVDIIGRDDRMTLSCTYPTRSNTSQTSELALAPSNDSGKIVVSVVIEVPNSGQKVHNRSGHHMRNRRSSLRSKRGRRPSSLGVRKSGGASPSSLKSLRHNGAQASPMMARRHGLRSSALRTGAPHRNVAKNINHVKSVSEGLKSEVDPTSCSSNVLVLGSDKCHRIVRATISLEASVEKQWNLVIKKDGMDPYILGAQRYMRPSSKNRVSNAVVWSTDNDWKLEFPDKQDWLIFKELYKKCSLLNTPEPPNPVESSIPIPGVREVSDYVSLTTRVFHRPASYISMKDDELSRALAGKTARYDMDSEDELWLNNLNGELGEENLDHTPLSAEDFELAIDALEKAFHCNPDAFSDECIPHIEFSLGRRVLEAVYGYWSNKKKQRRSALIKVFQLYQPRKTQLIPNSILRKKRSFKRQVSSVGKRQVSLVGRGKQRPLLQAMAAERVAREQHNSLVRVEEAKAVANRSEGLAILKRQRAQKLMEAADLAMYRAAMALRVAEMARNRPVPDDKVE